MSELRKRNKGKSKQQEYSNRIEKAGKQVKQFTKENNFLLYLIAFLVFLAFSVYIVEYVGNVYSENVIATQSDEFTRLFLPVTCSNDYGKDFKHCTPKKCGRGVQDSHFSSDDLNGIVNIVKLGMKHGGGSGGATILDLHSGALSYEDKFINLYKVNANVFNKTHSALYTKIKNKIRSVVAKEFDVDEKYLYLTKPTFFSRLDGKAARTGHDEYWHPHIDRVTYGTFYYTSLLYLTDYGSDFTGGRFMFVDKPVNRSVEPRKGRVSFFTSGSENEHFVERVESGTRYALTVSFTCDKAHAINDPSL